MFCALRIYLCFILIPLIQINRISCNFGLKIAFHCAFETLWNLNREHSIDGTLRKFPPVSNLTKCSQKYPQNVSYPIDIIKYIRKNGKYGTPDTSILIEDFLIFNDLVSCFLNSTSQKCSQFIDFLCLFFYRLRPSPLLYLGLNAASEPYLLIPLTYK